MILDTSPTGAPAIDMIGPDVHGFQMALLAQEATCDSDGDCVVDVRSQVAMGYHVSGSSFIRDSDGGTIGSLADLAVGIQRQVLDWQEDGEDPGPLVLNLSLGWHPEFVDTTMDPPVAAVYDALRYASCQGALVVAAVGNQDTPDAEANGSGPLYPAAWESVSAPDADTCSSLFDGWWTGEDPLGSETYTPLIYGVGAVDIDLGTLPTQRPSSVPPHNAAGSHLSGEADSDQTFPITGTSAASIVVASAAAVMRSHAPTQNAHTIMRILRNAASETLQTTADHCYDDCSTSCQPAVIIRVCESLTFAASKGLISPLSYANETCPDQPDPLSPTAADESTSSVDMVELSATFESTCSDGSTIIYDTLNSTPICPSVDLYGATSLPITLPMPHGTECPWCPAYIDPFDGVIELYTQTDLIDLNNPTIAVYRDTGVIRYPVVDAQMGQNNSTIVVLPEPLDEQVNSVVLEYTTQNHGVFISEPLYIVR